MRRKEPPVLSLILALYLVPQEPWVPEIPRGEDPIPDIDISESPTGIVPLPKGIDSRIHKWFDRYTKIEAPNGKPIHILAQEGWREDQIIRARKVLEHILTDVPGSRFGEDKSEVANNMAKRRATLVLFNTARDLERAFRGSFGEVELGCQDLRANECPVEGDDDYMAHRTRDAAFEEILHLVHDYGIRPAFPEYDEEVHQANVAATEKNLWRGWPDDEPENHRNEYLAAIYDNYLDLWTVKPTVYEGERIPEDDIPEGCSHFGRFRGDSRKALKNIDPTGYELLEDFFTPYLLYTPELPPDFSGTFSIRFDSQLRYTAKSQHLKNVTLTGDEDAAIIGNSLDNRLTGNEGDNDLEGGAGDDELIGGTGKDTAIYSGAADEYTIEINGNEVTVTDGTADRDGTDNLTGIEFVRFKDRTVELK